MNRNQRILKAAGQDEQSGMTLIEVMVVLVIVAVLAALAMPSYLSYARRGARSAGQAFLMDIAHRQEILFQNTRAYATNPSTAGFSLPSDVAKYYQPLATSHLTVTSTTFRINLLPIVGSSQAVDGTLVITSTGARCRKPNSVTTDDCDMSADKRWDQN